MISRRAILALGASLAAAGPAAAAVTAAGPTATLDTFYATLLSVMKDGKKLGFAGRRERLAPAVEQAFDLPLMTRLIVGLQWPGLSAADQRLLVTAFSNFSIANYASQFDDYSGERFRVDPKAAPAPGDDVIVHTQLVQSDGKPVELDYLMRHDRDRWRIIDVYLSGTVSQLAVRRSEFTAILRQRGASGLIAALQEKTAALAAGS